MSILGSDLATVIVAAVLVGLGGDGFLRGVLGAAYWLRVPKLLVATTLAAFATSSPELTVSTLAALSGKPEIGLGDALGSNVVNVALIFGLALLFGPIHAKAAEFGRDFALAIAVPLIMFLLAYDGMLSRFDGGLLLLIFAGWMAVVIRAGAANRTLVNVEDVPYSVGQTLVFGIGGLIALIVAGRLFVTGATGMAITLGIDTYVIGATVVAVGTSLPELVTVVLARMRGHDEIGIGTLIGSNLFNGLAIVGVATSIYPATIATRELFVAVAFGIAGLLLLIPNANEAIPRVRGVMLITLYATFVVVTLAIAHIERSDLLGVSDGFRIGYLSFASSDFLVPR